MFTLFSLILAAVVPIIAGTFLLQLYFEVDRPFKAWFLVVIVVLALFVVSYILEGVGLAGLEFLGPFIRRPLVSLLIMVLLPLLWAIKPCLVKHHTGNGNDTDPRILSRFIRYYDRTIDGGGDLSKTETTEETDRG